MGSCCNAAIGSVDAFHHSNYNFGLNLEKGKACIYCYIHKSYAFIRWKEVKGIHSKMDVLHILPIQIYVKRGSIFLFSGKNTTTIFNNGFNIMRKRQVQKQWNWFYTSNPS